MKPKLNLLLWIIAIAALILSILSVVKPKISPFYSSAAINYETPTQGTPNDTGNYGVFGASCWSYNPLSGEWVHGTIKFGQIHWADRLFGRIRAYCELDNGTIIGSAWTPNAPTQ